MNWVTKTYCFALFVLLSGVSFNNAYAADNICIKYDDITDSTVCINGEWYKMKKGTVSKRRYYVNNAGQRVYIEAKPNPQDKIPTQDAVYLVNGSILRGTVIEQVFNSHVKVQTNDGSMFVYRNDEIERILKEQGYSRQRNEQLKEPAIAFLLSFCITGAGQYYNGEYGKGLLQQCLVGTGTLMITVRGFEEEDEYIYHYDVEPKLKHTSWFYAGISMIAITQLWSLIDAPASAASINDRNIPPKYGMQIIPDHDGVKTCLFIKY